MEQEGEEKDHEKGERVGCICIKGQLLSSYIVHWHGLQTLHALTLPCLAFFLESKWWFLSLSTSFSLLQACGVSSYAYNSSRPPQEYALYNAALVSFSSPSQTSKIPRILLPIVHAPPQSSSWKEKTSIAPVGKTDYPS